MRALAIAPEPFFTPRGTPFSVYYRTLVTSELGAKVDLLTYGEGQDVNIPGVRIIRIPRFKFFGNVKVGPSLLKAFLDVFMVIWATALLIRYRYDFVHAHEEAVFFCSFLKPIFRFKLIYDMHSCLSQQLTNFQFTSSRLLIGVFKKLEDYALKSADVVITICPDLSNYVKENIENHHKQIMIENSIFDPVKLRTELREAEILDSHSEKEICTNLSRMPDRGQFIVYAGTLEPYQGIDILIQAFEKVVREQSYAFLIIVGGNESQVKAYSAMAGKHNLNGNIHFTGRVPQVLAQRYCGQASVLISPRSRGTNTPLKIYEQLASGIPIVATNIYSHTQVLNDSVAFLVEPSPEDMARGIIEALQASGESRRKTQNARQLYNQKYARPIYEKKMRRVLELLSD